MSLENRISIPVRLPDGDTQGRLERKLEPKAWSDPQGEKGGADLERPSTPAGRPAAFANGRVRDLGVVRPGNLTN